MEERLIGGDREFIFINLFLKFTDKGILNTDKF